MSEDGYANPVFGTRGALVRDQICSPDFDEANPTAGGWGLLKSGIAYLAGAVIRGTLRSANYVAGVAGYQLDSATGSAEFNDLTARGFFSTGPAGSERVTVRDLLGTASVGLYTGLSSESVAGSLGVSSDGTYPRLHLNGPNLLVGSGGGVFLTLEMLPPITGFPADAGEFAFIGSQSPWPFGSPFRVRVSDGGALRLERTNAVALGGDDHAAQIGPDGAANLCASPTAVQARNNGAAANLALNPLGGMLTCPDMRSVFAGDNTTYTTTSGTYVALSGTPPEITMPYPPSGSVLVLAAGRPTAPGAARCVMAYEIRDNDASGTLRVAANDDRAVIGEGTALKQFCFPSLRTGLPTSGTMFIRPMFRSSDGVATATLNRPTLIVIPQP